MKYLDVSVLFVEDEEVVRMVYSKLLSPYVREYHEAENGEQGLISFTKHNPDIVITDIRMPVMNGLDMIKKIRSLNPATRIILMSAYGESHYFLKAIEFSVRGFLLKPIDNEKFETLITTLGNEVVNEKKAIIADEVKRNAEKAILHNEQILKTVSNVAEKLIHEGFNNDTIVYSLEAFAKATNVSHAFFYEKKKEKSQEHYQCSQEWCTKPEKKIGKYINKFYVDKLPMKDLIPIIIDNKSFWAHTDSFSGEVQSFFENINIKSFLIIPISVNKKNVAFLVFCDCYDKHFWSNSECSSLETAGNIIGSALYRSQIEKELLQFNSQLEQMVKDRTEDLNKEIIEHINTQKMVSNREERYRLIFENANDGIIISIDRKFALFNPNAYDICGYTQEEIIGKEIDFLATSEYKELVCNMHDSQIKNESNEPSYDIKILSKSGEEKWVEIKSTLIMWDDQKAILSFITNITTRKFYEQRLRDLNENLEMRIHEEVEKVEKQRQLLFQKSRLESIGELSAGIAHELNQPLTGISLTLDNILRHINKENQDDYLKKKINLIFSDLNRIQHVIESVRDFSRESSDKSLKKLNVNDVIKNAMMFITRLLENHNISLTINLSDENLYCQGASFKLEQVILNLMSNCKYAVEKKEALSPSNYTKKITISSYKQGNDIIIEVFDNGIGIPENSIDNIFVPFFSTKEHTEGTGLGLSISYGIIKNMKGDIKAESVENEYTKMTVAIPELIE